MVNKILLKNIQCHELLELDCQDGLNLITGDSGTGKSAIFKAISWLVGVSNISLNDILREGADECSCKIWLNSGFQVERVRSSKINRYILSKDGCEDKIFDSVGRDVPEEIQAVLGLKEIQIENETINLNFASQDHLNFILDDKYSDIFKAKLFNVLTGNELIDLVFKDLNKESLSINRNIKTTEEQLVQQEADYEGYLASYTKAQSTLDTVTVAYNKLQNDIAIYEELGALTAKLKTNKDARDFVAFQASKIKTVSNDKIVELKKKAEELNYVQELTNKLIQVHNKIVQNHTSLCMIKVTNADFEALKKQAKSIDELNELAKKSKELNDKLATLSREKEALFEKIKISEKELEEAWKACDGICPLCKGVKHV